MSPQETMERLADAARTLAMATAVDDVIAFAPRLVREVSGADLAAVVDVDGGAQILAGSLGPGGWHEGFAAAAERAVTAGRSDRVAQGPGLVIAITPVIMAEARWAFAALHARGAEPNEAAMKVLAGLVGAEVGKLRAIDALRAQAAPVSSRAGRPSGARTTFEDLLGKDPAFLGCVELARRAASSEIPILITGETGTGKEMMAQAIHNASPRRAEPFVGINVAAIPRELLESELFGHERGAFTGARSGGKPGLFEVAEGGTVLLDEIGDMSLDLQVKILRVLQERVVTRVGGTRAIPLRALTIATTHRDLRRASEEGVFRADLYYRLRGVHIRVPPLRDRPSDIPLIAEVCLKRWAARTGRVAPKLSPRVLAAYMEHTWPGNVRELLHLVEAEASLLGPGESVIQRLPTVSRAAVGEPMSVKASSPTLPPPSFSEGAPPSTPSGQTSLLNEVERRTYADALRRFEGNVTKAARALGVSRGTMYNKMRRYGIEGSEP